MPNPFASDRIAAIRSKAERIVPADPAHDFSHMERVARLAVDIFSAEIRSREDREPTLTELECCVAAAYLHDCVPVAKNSPLRKESSRLSSEKAREWLKEWSWANDEIEFVSGAIHDHSYSSGRIPETLIGEALQDADRLESLGAIGLYRTLATGAAMGATLMHPTDPWAQHRELDDKLYSIDHFHTKLFKLAATFRTSAARVEAEKRTDYPRGFLDQLRREL